MVSVAHLTTWDGLWRGGRLEAGTHQQRVRCQGGLQVGDGNLNLRKVAEERGVEPIDGVGVRNNKPIHRIGRRDIGGAVGQALLV